LTQPDKKGKKKRNMKRKRILLYEGSSRKKGKIATREKRKTPPP